MAAAVLVVDSDEIVLDVTSAMLSRASFNVLTARSASSALALLHDRPEIALVLSEALLPGTSGVELVRMVQRLFPASAPMLMTAYTVEALGPAIPVLRKPFTVSELVGRVREVLARSREVRSQLAATLSQTQTTFERGREIRRCPGPGIFDLEGE